jgi:high-affinity Fe2+/Pb2+ permease
MPKGPNEQNPEETNYLSRGMGFGLIFGVALGVVFGVALDNMGFMAIGIGAGLTLGIAIGIATQERHQMDGS